MKPLVLVSTQTRVFDNFLWHAVQSTYLEAIAKVAGAQPLLVPNLAEASDFKGLLKRADAVLLTGGKANVHPRHYGAEPSEKYEPYDERRDATLLPFIAEMLKTDKPFLAVCRGLQEVNVALGGTIATEIQESAGMMDHRSADTDNQDLNFAIKHTVTPTKGGKLAAIVGEEDISVNSLHRQAVDSLAPGLTVEAKAEDGTIEAYSVTEARNMALAVQWHPEYWAASDDVSKKIFQALGQAARA